ncbi:MAG: TRAM domain-containing protein [Sedimentisphaerales bacterium]|nr:TRAM domain-containing protein [Sedimentisphaerales bacterium]
MLLYFVRAIFLSVIIAFLFVSINYHQSRSELPPDSETYLRIAAEKEKSGDMAAALEATRKAVEIKKDSANTEDYMAIFIVGVSIAVLVIAVEWLTPKKSLNALAGIFFGILVGALISWALSPVVEMINDIWNLGWAEDTVRISKWLMAICICYLAVSMVIQTKDDVRFVIPYVEFSRQTKGLRPLVLDTSVIIDGRISDIAQTRLFDAPLIVPRFILNELQLIADSSDKMKRNRGRRGLDILNKLQTSAIVEVEVDDTPPPGLDAKAEVDHKLVAFTKNCDGRLITNDYNLNKVAQLRGVDVININDMANALKTVVLPGETMQVRIVKPGEEPRQGIGYLDDGTMVVVEEGRDQIGATVQLTVTSALQTSAGRMIFGKLDRGSASGPRNGGSYRNRNSNDRPTA